MKTTKQLIQKMNQLSDSFINSKELLEDIQALKIDHSLANQMELKYFGEKIDPLTKLFQSWI